MKRPRVLDIALEAGVSTATVDRVVNERGGVSGRTVALVRRAEARLTDPDPRRRAQAQQRLDALALPCDVILPAEAGLSTDYLAAALRYYASRHAVSLRIRQIDRMNPVALAEALRDIGRTGSSGVAFQALDHPLVLEAAGELQQSGIPVATLVSGISSGPNLRHVGLDNRGAGRTTALLLGSFIAGAGRVAVVWSGSLSRAHEARESGFRTLVRDEFPGIEVVDIDIGRHEPIETLLKLQQTPGIGNFAGAYCVGAGLGSLVDAVSVLPRPQRPKIIGHNLTEKTREYLVNGSIAAIIHQDMARIAEEVVLGLTDTSRVETVTVPTIIVTRENLNQYLDLADLRPYASG